MGHTILAESSNHRELINLIPYILNNYSIEKKAGVVYLVTTHCSLEQLSSIQRFASRKHFQVSGLFNMDNNWKKQLISLFSDHTEISVDLKFTWGTIDISYFIDDSGKYSDYLSVKIGIEEASAGSFNALRNFRENTHKILDTIDITIDPKTGEHSSDKFKVTTDFTGSTNNVDFLLNGVDEHIPKQIIESFIHYLDTPNQCHVILLTDFNSIKELLTGKVIEPCQNCCEWNLGYGKPASGITNIKEGKLEQLAEFLIKEKLRGSFISFRIFRWNWEDIRGNIPVSNQLAWLLDEKKSKVKMQWYSPIPRGKVAQLKKELTTYLALSGRGKIRGR